MIRQQQRTLIIRILTALLTISLLNCVIFSDALRKPSHQKRVKSNFSSLLNFNRINSDLNGDEQSDRIATRTDSSGFSIEINFGNLSPQVTLRLPSRKTDLNLLVYDIDQDNDKDLIVTSIFSPTPLAVWLGDGHGNFHREETTTNDLLNTDQGPIYEKKGGVAERALPGQEERLQLGSPVSYSLPADLKLEKSACNWQQRPIQAAYIYQLSPRSPPHSFTP